MKLAAHTVTLSSHDWVTFDFVDGVYRMSYYRPQRSDSETGERIPRARVEAIKPDGMVLSPKADYFRTANKRRGFYDVLVSVLGEANAPHDPLTVEAYIRATAWGAKLP